MAASIVSEAELGLDSAADRQQNGALTRERHKLEQARQVVAGLIELLQADADNDGCTAHERLDARGHAALIGAIFLANECAQTIMLDVFDRQAHGNRNNLGGPGPLRAPRGEVKLCVPDDQVPHLPSLVGTVYARTSSAGTSLDWPAGAELPKVGEVVYLSSTSAWGVTMVIHERRPGGAIAVQVWLEYVSSARMSVPDGCSSAIH